MSRFANPDAKERLPLGPCECPGSPHDEDWIDVRTEIGAETFEDMGRFMLKGDSVSATGLLIVGWNLLDDDGSEAPVDADHIGRLFKDSFEVVNKWIDGHVRVETKLPNGSAARSPITSVASGSRRIQSPRKVA